MVPLRNSRILIYHQNLQNHFWPFWHFTVFFYTHFWYWLLTLYMIYKHIQMFPNHVIKYDVLRNSRILELEITYIWNIIKIFKITFDHFDILHYFVTLILTATNPTLMKKEGGFWLRFLLFLYTWVNVEYI